MSLVEIEAPPAPAAPAAPAARVDRTFVLTSSASLFHADCRDALRVLPDNSIDSIVTDPPYALVSVTKRFGKPGSSPAKSDGATGVYKRASAGFMGQQWDTGEVAFSAEFWAEALRVLKPGGHLAAFSGSRTYHRIACAIEDAGFEIRDQLHWLYGTGFPKSHDVAKGIAKARVEDREPVRRVCRRIRAAMDACGLKSKDLTGYFGDCHSRLIDHWAARDTDSQPSLPTWDQWQILRQVLPLGSTLDDEVWRLNGRKGMPGEAWASAEVVGEHEGQTGGFGDYRFPVRDNSIRRLDDVAAEWEGFGTALKPASEPIVLARKPLSEKSVAANVLRWRTGALNIDGCRVGSEVRKAAYTSFAPCHGNALGAAGTAEARRGTQGEPKEYVGRWPANVVHDGSDEVVAAFPTTKSGTGAVKRSTGTGYQANAYGKESRPAGTPNVEYGDAGSAARFFYSAKASKADRAGSKHPTVKPVALMQWLCRLVTPPGGVVLDPFAGSGTTGAAAVAEGFKAVLIEREGEYVADICGRFAKL